MWIAIKMSLHVLPGNGSISPLSICSRERDFQFGQFIELWLTDERPFFFLAFPGLLQLSAPHSSPDSATFKTFLVGVSISLFEAPFFCSCLSMSLSSFHRSMWADPRRITPHHVLCCSYRLPDSFVPGLPHTVTAHFPKLLPFSEKWESRRALALSQFSYHTSTGKGISSRHFCTLASTLSPV